MSPCTHAQCSASPLRAAFSRAHSRAFALWSSPTVVTPSAAAWIANPPT